MYISSVRILAGCWQSVNVRVECIHAYACSIAANVYMRVRFFLCAQRHPLVHSKVSPRVTLNVCVV